MSSLPGSAGRGTVHLVTVGVSLFDKLQANRSELKGMFTNDNLHSRIATAHKEFYDKEEEKKFDSLAKVSEAASEWLSRVTTPGSGEEREHLEGLLTRVEPRLWPAKASAELSTVSAKNEPGKSVALPEADTAILLASDTGKGLRAALFNAVAFADGKLDRVCYLPEPTKEIASQRGKVVIVRVPGLDAGDPAGFVEAMKGLGALGQGVDRMLEEAGDVAFFHLSGGFKAALPFLLGLGEALRSLRGKGKVQAFALHELSDDRSIELPLRSFSPDLLAKQLANTNTDGYFTAPPPDGRPLAGFAYEEVDNDWRLTPFGFALRALHRPENE